MISPGESSLGLKQFAHLFLSGEDSENLRDGIVPESLIWIISFSDPTIRAFLASGISGCISSNDINVTLAESGPGLPNAGYYFALEPEEYLLPVLENKALLKIVSGSLRLIYAPETLMFKQFGGGFASRTRPHIVVEAFNIIPGVPEDYGEELSRISALYSLNGCDKKLTPDVIVIFNSGDTIQNTGFLDSIVEFAPEASFFVSGNIIKGAASRLDLENFDMVKGIDASFGRRQPPSGSFFSGFTNAILQRISGMWKGR